MRKKMVEGQILPHHTAAGEALLWAFSQVRREKCVDPSHQKMAYMEGFVPQASLRYLMPASILSRVIQALNIQEKDTAFVIGAGTGYTAMILSYLAGSVTAFEQDKELLTRGQALVEQEGFHTIAYEKLEMLYDSEVYKETADVMVVEGAIESVPSFLTKRLKEKGRLACFRLTPGESDKFPMTEAIIMEKYNQLLTEKTLFLTDMPFLSFKSPEAFHES